METQIKIGMMKKTTLGKTFSFECKVSGTPKSLKTQTTADTYGNELGEAGEEKDDDSWTCITYVLREGCRDKLRAFVEGLKRVDHNYILNTRDFRGLGSFYFCTYPILPSKKYSSCWSDWGSKYGRVAPTKNEYLPKCSIFLVFEDLDVIMSKEQIECVINLINHNVFKFSYWMSGVVSTFENARASEEDEKMYMEYWPQFLMSNPTVGAESPAVDSEVSREKIETAASEISQIIIDAYENEGEEEEGSSERSGKQITRKELTQFVADFEILHSIQTIRILRNRANHSLNRLIRGFQAGTKSTILGSNMNECITNVLFTNICASYDNKESSQAGLVTSKVQERLQFVGGIYEIVSKQANRSGMMSSLKKLNTEQTFTVDLALDFLFINSKVILTNNMHTSKDETDIKGYILCSNGLHIFYQDTYGRDGSRFIEFEAAPFTIFSLDITLPRGRYTRTESIGEDNTLTVTYTENCEVRGGEGGRGEKSTCICDMVSGTPCILMSCGDCTPDPRKKNKKNLLSLLWGEDEENCLLPSVLYFASDYNHFRIPETSDVKIRLHLDSEIFMHLPIIDELSHILRIYKYNMDKHASTFPIKIDDKLKRLEYLAKEDSVVYELVDLGVDYQRKILQGSITYLNYDVNIELAKGLFLMFDVNLKGSYFTYKIALDLLKIKTLTRNYEEDEEGSCSADTLDSEAVTDRTEELLYSDGLQEGTCFHAVNMLRARSSAEQEGFNPMSCLSPNVKEIDAGEDSGVDVSEGVGVEVTAGESGDVAGGGALLGNDNAGSNNPGSNNSADNNNPGNGNPGINNSADNNNPGNGNPGSNNSADNNNPGNGNPGINNSADNNNPGNGNPGINNSADNNPDGNELYEENGRFQSFSSDENVERKYDMGTQLDTDGYDLHACIVSGLTFDCLNGMCELEERSVYMGKNCRISLNNYLKSVLRIKTKYLDRVEGMGEFTKLFESSVNLVSTDREVKVVVKTLTNMVKQNHANLIVSVDMGSMYVALRDVDMVGLICSLSDYKQIILKYAIKLDVVSEHDIKRKDASVSVHQNKYHSNKYIRKLKKGDEGGSSEGKEYFDDLMLKVYFNWNLLQESQSGERTEGLIKYEMNLDFFNLTFKRLISFNTKNSYYTDWNGSSPVNESAGNGGNANVSASANFLSRDESSKFGSGNYGFNNYVHGYDLNKLEEYVKFYGISTPLLSLKVTGFGIKVGILDSKIERICSYLGSMEVEDQSNCVPLYASTLFSGGNTTMLWSWLKVRREYDQYRMDTERVGVGSSGIEARPSKGGRTVSGKIYGYYKRVQRYIDATMDFDAHSHNHIYNADDQENLDHIVESIMKMNVHAGDKAAEVDLREMYALDTKSHSSSSNTPRNNRSSRDMEDESCNNSSSMSQLLEQYREDYTTHSSSFEMDSERLEISLDKKNSGDKDIGVVGMVFGGCPCFVSLSLISGTTRSCSIYVSSSIVTLPWEVIESVTTYFNSINAYIKDNTNQSGARENEDMYKDDDEYTEDLGSTDAGSQRGLDEDYQDASSGDWESKRLKKGDVEHESNKFGLEDTDSVSDVAEVGEDDSTLVGRLHSEGTSTPTDHGHEEEEDVLNRQFYRTPEESEKKFSFNVHVGISCMNLFTESAWTGYGYFLKYLYHKTVPSDKAMNLKWNLVRNILRDKNRKAYMIYPITINITGQGSLYLTHARVVNSGRYDRRRSSRLKYGNVHRRTKFDMYCKETIDQMFDGWFHFMPCVFEVKLMSRNVSVKLTREASGAILTPSGYTMCDVYLDISSDFRHKRANFIKYIKMSLLMDKRYYALVNLAKNSLYDPTNLNTSKIVDPFRSTVSAVFYLYGNDRNTWATQIMPQSLSVHLKLEPLNVSVNCIDFFCLMDFSNLLLSFFELFKQNYTLILHASDEFLEHCKGDYTTLEKIRITKLFSKMESGSKAEGFKSSSYSEYSSCVSSRESWYTNQNSSGSLRTSRLKLDEMPESGGYASEDEYSCESGSNYNRNRTEEEMYETISELQSYYDSGAQEPYARGARYLDKEEAMSSSSADYEEAEGQSLLTRILSTLSVGVSVDLELINVEIVSSVTSEVKHMFALTVEDTGLWFWVNNIFDCEFLDARSKIPSLEFGEEGAHRATWFNDPLLHKDPSHYHIGDVDYENVAYLEQFSGVLRGGLLEMSSSSLPQAMKYKADAVTDTQVIIDELKETKNIIIRDTATNQPESNIQVRTGFTPLNQTPSEIYNQDEDDAEFEANRSHSGYSIHSAENRNDVVILINDEYKRNNVRYSIVSKKQKAEKVENLIGVQADEENNGIGLENILHVDEMIDVEKIPSIASFNKFLGASSDDMDLDETYYENRQLDQCYRENVKNFMQFRFKTSVTIDLCREGNREMAVETFTVSLMGYKPSLATKLLSRLESSWINVNVTLNAAECYFGFLSYVSVMLKLRKILLEYSIEEAKILDSVTKYTINDQVPRLSAKAFEPPSEQAQIRTSKEYGEGNVMGRATKDLSEYTLSKLSRDSRPSKDMRISKMFMDTKLSKLSVYSEADPAEIYSMPINSVTKDMFAKCITYRYFNGLLQPCGVMNLNKLIGERLKAVSELKFLGIKKLEPLYQSYLKFDTKEPTGKTTQGDLKEDFAQYKTDQDIYNVPIEHNVVHVGKLGHGNVFGSGYEGNMHSRLHNNLGQPIAVAMKGGQASHGASIHQLVMMNTATSNTANEFTERANVDATAMRDTGVPSEDSYTWLVLRDGASCELPVGHYGILEPFLVKVKIGNYEYEITSSQLDLSYNNNQMMFKLDLNPKDDLGQYGVDSSVEETEKRRESSTEGFGVVRFAREYVKRLMGRKELEKTYNHAYLMVNVEHKTVMQSSSTSSSSINIYFTSGLSVTNKSREMVVVFPASRTPENRTVSQRDLMKMDVQAPSVSDTMITKSYFRESRMTDLDKLFKPISVLTDHKLVKKIEPRSKKSVRQNSGINESYSSAHMSAGELQYIVLRGGTDNPDKAAIPLPWIVDGNNTICVALLSDFSLSNELSEIDEETEQKVFAKEIPCDVLLSREATLHIVSSFEGQRIKVPVPGFAPTLHLGRSKRGLEREGVHTLEPMSREPVESKTQSQEHDYTMILSCTLNEFTSVHKTQIPLNPMKHCLKQYEFILEPIQVIENMMPYDINIISPKLYASLNTQKTENGRELEKVQRAISFDNVADGSEEEHMRLFSRSLSISTPQLVHEELKDKILGLRPPLGDVKQEDDEVLSIKSGTSMHLDKYMTKAIIFFKDFCSNEVLFKKERANTTLVFERVTGALLENAETRLNVDPRPQSSYMPAKITVSVEIFKRSVQPSKDKEGLIKRCLASSQIVCSIYADKWAVNWLGYPILLSRSDARYIQCFGGNGCSVVSQDLSNTGLHMVVRKNNLKKIHAYDMYKKKEKGWSLFRLTSPSHLISNKFVVPELTFSACSIRDVPNYPNLHYLVSTSIAPMPFFRTVVMEILPQVTITNDFDLDIWIREYFKSKSVVKSVIKKTGIFSKLNNKVKLWLHRRVTSTKDDEEHIKTSARMTLAKYSRSLHRMKSAKTHSYANRKSTYNEDRGGSAGTANWIKVSSGMTVEFHSQSKGEFYLQVTAINPADFQNLKNIKFWSCSLLIKPSSSTQFRYPESIKYRPSMMTSEKLSQADIVKYGLCEVETLVHKGCKMVRFLRPMSPEWMIINATGFNLYIQQLGILSHGEILERNSTLKELNTTRVNTMRDLNNRDYIDLEFQNGVEYGWYDPQKEQKLIIKLHHLQDKNNEVLAKYATKANVNVNANALGEKLFVKVKGALLIDLGKVESINATNMFNVKMGQMRLMAKLNAQTSVIMGQRTLILTCGKLNKLLTRNKKLFDIYKQIKIKIPNTKEQFNPRNYLLNRFKYNAKNVEGIRVSARRTNNTYPFSGGMTNRHLRNRSPRDTERMSTKMLYLRNTALSGARSSSLSTRRSAVPKRHTYPLTDKYRPTNAAREKEVVINISNDYTLNISLNGLGVCVCSYLPDELLYVSLVLVQFNTSFQDNESRYEFSVGWLQSDVHDIESYFPTMVKPVINYSPFNVGSINRRKASSYVHHDVITNSNKQVINIVMNTKSNRYIKEISLLSIDIQPININLDTRIIFSTLLLLDDYLSVFSQSERSMEAFSAPHVGIFNYENMQSFDDDVYTLSDVVRSQYGADASKGARYNISRLIIGKIVMVINIRRSEALQMDELPLLSPTVRYLLYIVRRTPHISDAHIVLNKESLLRLCCTPYVLLSHFGSRYVSQAIHQIYKVLWAVDLIGNPKMIFNHWFSALYQSLIDFREALRFVHLPPVTFLLLLKGVSQFGISVLSGIVDAFYRFTGSWCILLNAMALNSDRYAVFLLNEVFPKNFGHPSNVFEGLYFGTMMMGRNLYISLGNFVFKPVNSFNKFLESIRLRSGNKEVLMSFLHIWSSLCSSLLSLLFGSFSSALSGLSITLQGLLNQMHSVPMLSAIRPRRSLQHLKSTGPIRYNFLESWSMEASKRIGHTNQVLLVLPLDVKLKLFDPVYLATSHWSVLATHISSISPLILSQSFGNFKDLIWIDRLNVGYVEKGRIKWKHNIKSVNRIQLIELNAELSSRGTDEFDIEEVSESEEYENMNKGINANDDDVRVVIYDSHFCEKKVQNTKLKVVLPLKKGKKLLGKRMYFMRIMFSEPGEGRQFKWTGKKKIPLKLQITLQNPYYLQDNASSKISRTEGGLSQRERQIHKQIHENLGGIARQLNRLSISTQRNNEGELELEPVKKFGDLYNIKKELVDINNYVKTLSKVKYKNVDEGERTEMIKRKRESEEEHNSKEWDLNEEEQYIYDKFNSIISDYTERHTARGRNSGIGRQKGHKSDKTDVHNEMAENEEEEWVEIVKMPNLETGKLYFTLLTSVIREVAL
ncbi:uncharacterized protein TOT_010001259 [Theileria orientalis strain Shintoku]|uniref:Uncharacterized protein n=1 Tax=Theileria orientalis strain Shintoku TaxID=869250 RepID=J4C2M7_THEOR|nr:uncharacterized protein TOT_010001259 [Theileria orientalis strain Shintoku]BAM38961.1 uncharacterized protein TOT_010001259 [Theileria orientalis strain Shintoku]|eukprot:XP_009689262.1 uncharacterized protein TOT_010001259 [Theileria orientalis strain Shintoku]